MEEQRTGPVTMDEVKNTLGDTSPFDTNAHKLRTILGRGSNSTIQQLLDQLRAQRTIAAQPATEHQIPKPPQEAVEMLWAAAWGAAQAKTLGRLESLSADRDSLFTQSQSQAADIASLTEQLDTLEALSRSQSDETKAEKENLQADVQSAKTAMHVQEIALEKAKTESEIAATHADALLLKTRADAGHAAELAFRDSLIERQTLQMTIDRLSEQLAESKAMHMAYAMEKKGKNENFT